MATNSTWFTLGALALLTLGVGVAQAQSRILPQPVPPGHSYLCFDGSSAGEVMQKANEAGARGWKMVGAAGQGGSSIWCFEQLSAARPSAK